MSYSSALEVFIGVFVLKKNVTINLFKRWSLDDQKTLKTMVMQSENLTDETLPELINLVNRDKKARRSFLKHSQKKGVDLALFREFL